MAGKRHKTPYPGIFYREVPRPGGKGTEKVYYAVWKERGKVREARVGAEFRDAMTPARAAKIRGQYIEKERQTPAEKRAQAKANMPIAQLWEAYASTIENQRTLASLQSDFRRIPEEIAKSRPFEISTRDVAAWDKKMVKDGFSPQTRRHSLSLLSRLIKWGVKFGHCDEAPDLRIDLPPLDNRKTEFLDDEAMQKLFEALDADHDQLSAHAVRIVVFTGIRKSALLGLRWTDLDFERGFIVLRGENAKNARTERIPMSDNARAVFEEVAAMPFRPDSEFVFPTSTGGRRHDLPKSFLARIRERAGLPEDFRPLHGLRHTFASRLASSGKIDMYTLQRLLTHESPEMTQRYAHLMDEAMRRAAGVVDEVLGSKTEK